MAQENEFPILCANNCGFFGSRATRNLCSKCFNNSRPTRSPRVVEIEVTTPASRAEEVPVFIATRRSSRSVAVVDTSTAGSDAACPSSVGAEGPSRCYSCRKKVGLTGFKCRCGGVFCAMHRYSDEHECSFDYKAAGRESIAKANPQVIASKVHKI